MPSVLALSSDLAKSLCNNSGVTNHEQTLAAAAARYREFLNARQELGDAIRAAAADDVRQVDILRAIDNVWTREKVRQECKKAGDAE